MVAAKPSVLRYGWAMFHTKLTLVALLTLGLVACTQDKPKSDNETNAPAPAAEKAVPLSDEDIAAFARVTSGVLHRAWADSIGASADGPLSALPVSEAEYATLAAPEALPKRPPPKKKKKKAKAKAKKRPATREKSLKTRSGRKKPKKSRKKKSRR